MTTLLLVLAAATAGQEKPAEKPAAYHYVQVTDPKPGQDVYAGKEGPAVFFVKDVFAFRELDKSFRAGDRKGADDLIAARRLSMLDGGTRVKVIERINPLYAEMTGYEVRVLDGDKAGQKGIVIGLQLMTRRPGPEPAPAKAKPARKKRR